MSRTNKYCGYFLAFFVIAGLAYLSVMSRWQSPLRALLPCFIGGFFLLFGHLLVKKSQMKELLLFASIVVLLTTVLTWNYMTNAMDVLNTDFDSFQADSEMLVRYVIQANQENVPLNDFGLLLKYKGPDSFSYYKCQYGLQGKVFGALSGLYSIYSAVFTMQMFCSFLTAVVFVLITLLLCPKYDAIMATCFFATVWLSPWVVNFARNLYWVEFTWFIPMLLGLFCSIHVNKKWCRVLSYIGVFLSILVKCLCGYEYITCIMMAMISFLFLDLVQAIMKKDRQRAWFLFRTTFIMGAVAVLGFVAALLMHAQIRGSGDLLQGLIRIYEQDVVRRVALNPEASSFDPVTTSSLKVAVSNVLGRYFKFSTHLLVGLQGNLFPLLTVLPVFIFVYQLLKKKLNVKDVLMYVFFFITCISWFVLAKPHSYIHTHMNYVLWYFGHVQVCLYIICKQIKHSLFAVRGI